MFIEKEEAWCSIHCLWISSIRSRRELLPLYGANKRLGEVDVCDTTIQSSFQCLNGMNALHFAHVLHGPRDVEEYENIFSASRPICAWGMFLNWNTFKTLTRSRVVYRILRELTCKTALLTHTHTHISWASKKKKKGIAATAQNRHRPRGNKGKE